MKVQELIVKLLEEKMDSEVQISVEAEENTYTVDIDEVDATSPYSGSRKYVYLNGKL